MVENAALTHPDESRDRRAAADSESLRAQLCPPPSGDNWFGYSALPLPVDDASRWVVRSNCGAVVVFSGTARDHAEGRDGVVALEYEAYEEQLVPAFERVARAMRAAWPDLGRIVLLHRTGVLALGDAAVVVAVSAPHRATAFDAARFGIDSVKDSAPIWKRERWAAGEDWGTGSAAPVRNPSPPGATMESS